ncbi:glucans biosynthesis glucosyltransferase MdoH [Allorhodopirellula heiligendammensis]|uniref:Glucans biosynthesis glucosyltransferase H n=1 Tax=Allorhodopirellula heiligendammensis TaxID=2714739 RepID=A0A5C6C876_9BACT|nr:glucans biosynthesis glucosyltransferase MdoH [Allorhodopirellula heiligendammensis]TWU18959.1 Glucans biosynthesis glucosyltransferase H [Allorhodopirellula heiligendammensis]
MNHRVSGDPARSAMLLRYLVLSTTVLLSTLGCIACYQIVVADGGTNPMETVSLALFAILFTWISFSCSLGTFGFLYQLPPMRRWRSGGERDGILPEEPSSAPDVPESTAEPTRTAILVPVYNESPTRVFAAVAAMREQLQDASFSTGEISKFDFFVLSDTTDPDVWLEEEWCWSEILKLHELRNSAADPASDEIGIFYRHRSRNDARKAGNIAEFCENWGSHYEFMIVLDADSLMTAETMIEMARRMQMDRQLGILQVPPVPVGRRSLFARMQQFAAAVYGSTFAEGFDRFAGDQGNYWGHNAILRIAPFMRHCQLPILQGAAPLGGEILSHDFVEAALMVRAGFKVRLANDLGGSYEECPTTILDFVKRDQRWCQGNLQHWRILLADRIHPLSRMHFFSGILSYVAAPLWLMFMTACLAAAVWNQSTGSWSSGDRSTPIAVGLFIASMTLLLLPKVLAIIAVLLQRPLRERLGGGLRIVGSAIVETLISTVFAPLIAVYHSRFVISILAGQTVKWNAQQRGETAVTWSEATAQMWKLTLAGLILLIGLAAWQPLWLVWFAPVILGWLLSIPLTVAMGSRRVGQLFANGGLLQIAAERHPEPILSRHQYWIDELDQARGEFATESWFDRLLRDPDFRNQHVEILLAAASQLPVQEHEPEWAQRWLPIERAADIPNAARRRLLCDDGWLKAIPAK